MNTAYIREQIRLAAENARKSKPLAGSITNFVTVNFVANAQLAAGGSAAMVYLPDEGEGLVKMGDSMYINVGTLLPIYEETVPRTLNALCKLGKPWVLDPVAVGLARCGRSCCFNARNISRRLFAATRRKSLRWLAYGR